MKNLLLLVKKLILAKWIFKKPKNFSFLIYDRAGSEIFHSLLKKKQFHILDVRGESINFYVLLRTICKSGFVNITINYRINYFIIVDPKFIITMIDNNLAFYKLKKIFKKPKYISIQGGRRDNIFFDQCYNYYLKNTERLQVDIFFVLGQNEIERFSKYIKAKFYCLGSIKNNHFFLKKNKHNNIKKILFVSKKDNFLSGFHESRIFNLVYKYCEKNNYQLNLCTRSFLFEEKYYRDKLKGDWVYIPYSMKSSYNSINSSDLVVYTNSTLGLEALVKGKKVAAFPLDFKSFPIAGYNKKFSKTGPFWISNCSDQKVFELLRKVECYSQYQWKFIIRKYVSEVISYNPKNKIFIKKLNRYKIYD
jgi:hypothetical protein